MIKSIIPDIKTINNLIYIILERGIEQGKIQGKTEGKIEILYVDLHFSIAEIAQKLKMSEEHVQRIVKKIEDKK